MSRDGESRRGISLRTLAIASAASACATIVVPMFWRPGTIAFAAAMPVIVALISEALDRPVDRVSRAGQRVREQRRDQGRPADPFGLRSDERRRRATRTAVVTGLLAFALVAVVWTATELAAGESVSGGERTTYFGGSADRAAEGGDDGDDPAPATSPEDPADGPDRDAEGTPTPEPTATPAPEGTAEPTPGPEATSTPPPGTAAPAEPTPTPAP